MWQRRHIGLLPADEQLLLGTLAADSPWTGKALQDIPLPGAYAELIAVLRRGHLQLPQPDLVLEPKDRLLFLASARAWADLRIHISHRHQGFPP